MNIVRPFLIALQFLTLVPLRLRAAPDERDVGLSVLYYPVVGVLIGAALAALAALVAARLPLLLSAALLLAMWALITGGLHLDGLADSADAWAGGRGERERTLALMKDPHCGPIAVVVLVVVLLIKFAALCALVSAGSAAGPALAPVLGRIALPLLLATTPYVRPGGLGSIMAAHLPPRAAMLVAALAAACAILVAGTAGLWMTLAALATFVVLRGVLISRIGGTTGDTAGAMVELIETVTIAVAAALTG